mgnify:CR=1 FL=1
MFGMAQPGSVVAEVLLSNDPYHTRRVPVWVGAAYQAVTGSWRDQDLYARIKAVLEGTVTPDQI